MSGLLERDDDESVLHTALSRAREGDGGLVLVAGEAGIGKSTLVRAFVERAAGRPRVLVGACDPVSSPRPLGPLIDVARSVDPGLATRLAGGLPRAESFGAALDLLDDGDSTTVLVIEDVHWADDATLDLFTFLARRLEGRRLLMIVTFRSDEVGPTHPLRLRLGDVHHHVHARIDLRPLSLDGVTRLVGPSPDLGRAAQIHRITGGNPFHVTEVLGSDDDLAVPASVRDAVLARASRLPPDARQILDAASVVPGAVDRWLLDALADRPGLDVAGALDTCFELGLLRRRSDHTIEFRHELARLAIADALAPARRRRFHERALHALSEGPGKPDHARLARHADEADDGPAVLEHAPLAADEARRLGSHREAASLLETALRYGHLVDGARRGELWLRLGRECNTLGRFEDALAAFDRSAAEFERVGDSERQAESLVACDGPLWGLGRHPEVLGHLERAAQLIGDDPRPSRGAAVLASAWASAHMLAREPGPALAAGDRAVRIAELVDEPAIVADASIIGGIAACMAGDDEGLERLRHGIEVAERIGDEALVSLGYSMVGTGYCELRRYEIAMPALRDGLEYMNAREFVSRGQYQAAWLARCELEVGAWDEAGDRAGALARNPRCVGNSRLVVLVTLAWLRVRRGDPGVSVLLDEALALARRADHIQRLWPAPACRAEHAWMTGRLDDELPITSEILARAVDLDYRPAVEELEHWLAIAEGRPRGDATAARTPFGLSAGGRADLAVARWDAIGCPYEAAMARVATAETDALRQAHDTFTRLGATPMRERTATLLRERGAAIPRGSNRTTRDNPHGLTDREIEVLAVLPSGSTNAEIGGRLHISQKTVGHHVSRILAKLGVGTRAEAAVAAVRLGLTTSSDRSDDGDGPRHGAIDR